MEITQKNVLVCAIGGGFDIFAAIPLLSTILKDKNVTFSSYNLNKFTNPIFDYKGEPVELAYFPEKIFAQRYTVNVSGKVGVKPLKQYYNTLIKMHDIEHIITIDCGVDSLMFGDEQHKGTIGEEYINFAALESFNIEKTHICLGFGTETEEHISHYRVLENISSLIMKNGFKGSFSLLKDSIGFKEYKETYETVKNFLGHKVSHIHPRIINAVEGGFGDKKFIEGTTLLSITPTVFISPLMGMYWLFDGSVVLKNIKHILDTISNTTHFVECASILNDLPKNREDKNIPY